jgi:nucleotide-binding universal stress UspA family protein
MDCLLYVDPSPRGEWALDLAALILPGLAGRVLLLVTAEDAAKHPALLSRARARLSGIAKLEEQTAAGPAEKAIGAEVIAHRYDLVVVPPAGRNALQRMLKGSRVATVVRSVPASVLVARRPPPRLERILAALSGGPATGSVVKTTLEMERASGARATFLHVASEVALPYPPEHDAAASPPPEDAAARARAALLPFGRELVVREGLVVDEILAEVEHSAHHLLVAGAEAAGDPGGWAREDVAERLLLACGTSVLIAR